MPGACRSFGARELQRAATGGSPHLLLIFEQVELAIEPRGSQRALLNQRLGSRVVLGLEDREVAGAFAASLAQHARCVDRDVGLLEKAADLLLHRWIDRIGGSEKAHPDE